MLSLVLALLALIWAPQVGAMTIEQVSGTRGVAAWFVEDHALPVVSIWFAFPGGAALDPSGKGGLAAMAAALLAERAAGTGEQDTDESKEAFHGWPPLLVAEQEPCTRRAARKRSEEPSAATRSAAVCAA